MPPFRVSSRGGDKAALGDGITGEGERVWTDFEVEAGGRRIEAFLKQQVATVLILGPQSCP